MCDPHLNSSGHSRLPISTFFLWRLINLYLILSISLPRFITECFYTTFSHLSDLIGFTLSMIDNKINSSSWVKILPLGQLLLELAALLLFNAAALALVIVVTNLLSANVVDSDYSIPPCKVSGCLLTGLVTVIVSDTGISWYAVLVVLKRAFSFALYMLLV